MSGISISSSTKSGGFTLEKRYLRKDGRIVYVHIDTRCVCKPDGSLDYLVATIQDITSAKANEEKLRRVTRLYATLSQCNEHIMRCEDEQTLLPLVCEDAVKFGELQMVWLGMTDPATKMVVPVAHAGRGVDYLRDIQISVDEGSLYALGPTGTAIRAEQPFWCGNFDYNPIAAPWRERAAQFGWKSVAALPLHRGGSVVGALTVYSSEPDIFDDASRNLLLEMARISASRSIHSTGRRGFWNSSRNCSRPATGCEPSSRLRWMR